VDSVSARYSELWNTGYFGFKKSDAQRTILVKRWKIVMDLMVRMNSLLTVTMMKVKMRRTLTQTTSPVTIPMVVLNMMESQLQYSI
jgi:hypothetical protein